MSKGLKLGAIPYLNAEPLLWPLENGTIPHTHKIIKAIPSHLEKLLEEGVIDCALTSVATILNFPKLVPVPEIAIASRGAVASVLVFHNDPFGILDTIWLDPSSVTSNILVQILRDRASETSCRFLMPGSIAAPEFASLPKNTGRLLIGNPALSYCYDKSRTANFTDLGELWREKTNQPFTFARWLARNGDIAAELKPLLLSARDWSLRHLNDYVGQLSGKHGFPVEVIDRYLRINITYVHGPREQAGERLFFTLARNLLKIPEKNLNA
jgi:chorismate dehydratase